MQGKRDLPLLPLKDLEDASLGDEISASSFRPAEPRKVQLIRLIELCQKAHKEDYLMQKQVKKSLSFIDQTKSLLLEYKTIFKETQDAMEQDLDYRLSAEILKKFQK